ncbi:MAG: septum formation protein Maf [Bacteroidales bacterium]|nr:septum formation protein Maf [Bacteroidales bacterium]
MNLKLRTLSKYNLILASRSPRRQALLRGLDLDFQVVVKNTDESFPPEIPIQDVPEFLSRKKAESINLQKKPKKTIVITADTVVILDEAIIEKPASEQEAKEMLWKLSGRQHTVITGVCLTSLEKQVSFSSVSQVYFKNLSEDDIKYYVEKYQPYDKAGSYGIQEWIGYVAIERIEGSFYNVMGLPTQRLFEELVKFVEN